MSGCGLLQRGSEGPVDADLDKPAMDDCESPCFDLGHRYRINQTTDVTTPLHEELKRMSYYFQPNRKQNGSGWAHGIGLRIASLGGKALIITLMTGEGSGWPPSHYGPNKMQRVSRLLAPGRASRSSRDRRRLAARRALRAGFI